MTSTVTTSTINGFDAVPVDVEVKITGGANRLTIIGLGDAAVRESKDRVASAIRSSGFKMPDGSVLVNLAPAEVKKEGSAYDLAIAAGILAASRQLDIRPLHKISVHGELALDGRVKPVRGAVSMAASAAQRGSRAIIVPIENVAEASLIDGLSSWGFGSLNELVNFCRGAFKPAAPSKAVSTHSCKNTSLTLSDVKGQSAAKRALLIAAAGKHNILMIGPPGCGKSMLAKRFSSLLPPLGRDEKLEAVKVHSIAGLPIKGLLEGERPFRSPHHVISEAGLIGGGSIPRPGEISLAHYGVLFLDEFPEFRRGALEALRAPLENGTVTISRAKAAITFPADFQLIAAMNPCPCGRFTMEDKRCTCSLNSVRTYLKKLSRPILDRIDLHVDLDPVPIEEITAPSPLEDNTATLREKVLKARQMAVSRSGTLNGHLSNEEITKNACASKEAMKYLKRAAEKMGFSARGYFKVLKTARTIADLRNAEKLRENDIAEAVSFRALQTLESALGGN